MRVKLERIELREVLHMLGWHGTPIDDALRRQIDQAIERVLVEAEPRIMVRRFRLEPDMTLAGTSFCPLGRDVREMLTGCTEAVLMAATMGAAAERLLLRAQAKGAAQALLVDAALSAAVEEVLDRREEALRAECRSQGQYLTDRFSPGYGDMPIEQTREICAVLDTVKNMGLTVSSCGIMIPRKSVTAILGISAAPVARRKRGCEACSAREHCALRRTCIQKG